MSDADDIQVGQILSRRDALVTFGAAGAALALPFGLPADGRASAHALPFPACVVRPAQTAGPYYVDTKLDRSDIRSDPTDGRIPEGMILELMVVVSRLDGTSCAPYPGVVVDLWQCDAVGVYSGVKDMNGLFDTTGKQFLRGHQRTGTDGVARFRTIYPGFYQGRAPHIHFKLRTDPDAASGRAFVSQLYFEDSISDGIYAGIPYSGNRQRRIRNAEDRIFQQGGAELVIGVKPSMDGMQSRFDIGITAG